MYYVFILKSKVVNRYYIGSTESVAKRLEVHNSTQARWTKRYQPWDVIHQESFESRSEAVKRERELKATKNIERCLTKIRNGEL